jgi:hypothetical protein
VVFGQEHVRAGVIHWSLELKKCVAVRCAVRSEPDDLLNACHFSEMGQGRHCSHCVHHGAILRRLEERPELLADRSLAIGELSFCHSLERLAKDVD